MYSSVPFDFYVNTGINKSLVTQLFIKKQLLKKRSYLRDALHNMTLQNINTLYENRKMKRLERCEKILFWDSDYELDLDDRDMSYPFLSDEVNL